MRWLLLKMFAYSVVFNVMYIIVSIVSCNLPISNKKKDIKYIAITNIGNSYPTFRLFFFNLATEKFSYFGSPSTTTTLGTSSRLADHSLQ